MTDDLLPGWRREVWRDGPRPAAWAVVTLDEHGVIRQHGPICHYNGPIATREQLEAKALADADYLAWLGEGRT